MTILELSQSTKVLIAGRKDGQRGTAVVQPMLRRSEEGAALLVAHGHDTCCWIRLHVKVVALVVAIVHINPFRQAFPP